MREKEKARNLQVVRLGQKNMLRVLERAIDSGQVRGVCALCTYVLGRSVIPALRTFSEIFVSLTVACLFVEQPVLIENMGERIDAVLNPVIARSTIKKGHKQYLMLGDKVL